MPTESLIFQSQQSSSPVESHHQALTDPDVSLSTHPAPIVQPEAAFQVYANVQIAMNAEELHVLTSVLLFVVGLSFS